VIRMFDSTSLPALEQTAIFTQRRHELLAGNLANLDTPDYRARDLQVDQFQQALAESIQRAGKPMRGEMAPTRMPESESEKALMASAGLGLPFTGSSLAESFLGGSSSAGSTATGSTSAGPVASKLAGLAHSLTPKVRDDFASGPRAAMEPIVLHDGSDVSLERQVTEIAKNQGLHNLAIATMRNQFALLRAAITERA
jgi:flagellar basal-body rod protein FlgB